MERRLGAQERDVLRLYGSGLSVEEIADRLQISETTVAWIVGNLVSEWGARRTDELARTLAISRRDRFFAQFAMPLGVMLVLTVATFVAIGATGTLHGPQSSPQATQTASPTTFGSVAPNTVTGAPSPSAAPAAPVASDRSPASDASAPVPTLAPPTLQLPTLAPIVPTLPPILPTPLPTVAPTLPLPPLPTVPPLPTPPRL